MHLIAFLLIGLCAGFLAAKLVEGEGLGCLMNTLVGVAGAIIGGLLVDHWGPDTNYGFFGSIVVAFIGAALFLAVLRLLGVGPKKRGLARRRW